MCFQQQDVPPTPIAKTPPILLAVNLLRAIALPTSAGAHAFVIAGVDWHAVIASAPLIVFRWHSIEFATRLFVVFYFAHHFWLELNDLLQFVALTMRFLFVCYLFVAAVLVDHTDLPWFAAPHNIVRVISLFFLIQW